MLVVIVKAIKQRFIKNILKLIFLILGVLVISYIVFTWCQVRGYEEEINEFSKTALQINNSFNASDNIAGINFYSL